MSMEGGKGREGKGREGKRSDQKGSGRVEKGKERGNFTLMKDFAPILFYYFNSLPPFLYRDVNK